MGRLREERPGPARGNLWKFVDLGRLGDNVGGQSLAYNQKVGGSVFVFGYPSGCHPHGDHTFSGKTLK
ncbi:hypothetical protein [Microbispora sp. NPDC049125]|uniref:hypothetical protein n=1 Tax=Microbispora sp. NPDC049125 TaxID=3154929 RepID=UPI003467944E